MTRHVSLTLGWLAFGLGFIGMFLPLLPTVPLWILAAWLFTHHAPHLKERIYHDPRVGHLVEDFLEYRVLSRRAKGFALPGIAVSVGLSLWLSGAVLWIGLLVIAIMLPVMWYLFALPEHRPVEK